MTPMVTMGVDNNVQVIQEIYAAFGRGDGAAVMAALGPDAVLIFESTPEIPWAGRFVGPEGWGQFFSALGETGDEVALQMEPFAAQGDRVVAYGRYQARVKATGKRIDSPLVHLWTLRDGKVAECIELTNTAVEAAAFKS